jgi:hypothetical protein
MLIIINLTCKKKKFAKNHSNKRKEKCLAQSIATFIVSEKETNRVFVV